VSGQRMCPNKACEKHGEPTGLMGGCDCGTALVPYRTREQQVDDALWALASPVMRRLVGYSLFAEMDRQRRDS
jgi:hypothetical protein